jgi:hypothetical protein
MRPVLLVFLIVYGLAVPVVTTLYFVQEQITHGHIVAARSLNEKPARVVIRDDSGKEQQAKLLFVDDHLVSAHGRMGNEIEEHIAILLALNLLSSGLVFVMGIALWPHYGG